MTEYELHQLILASRAEFDISTLAMIFISLAFIALARLIKKDNWPSLKNLLVNTYVVVSLLVLIRTIASIIRFGKLNLLLQSMEPDFLVSNPALQVPTALLRIAVFVLLFLLTLNVMKQSNPTQKR